MSDNVIEQKHDLESNFPNSILPNSKSILKESPVQNSEKIKVHEFTRENRIESFDTSVDHFGFKSEKDIKYDFMKPKKFFS
jgi:hypothetical protein